jgi:hypothetical protein
VIKAGQALSSRPDLLPNEYLEELQKLQDRLPAFEDRLAFEVVDQELGVPFDQVGHRKGWGGALATSGKGVGASAGGVARWGQLWVGLAGHRRLVLGFSGRKG